MTDFLHIEHLNLTVANKTVITDLFLSIQVGQIHAIMGPNGSGKSSLAHAIMGHPQYVIANGLINFNGVDITGFTPDQRARAGLFLSFQDPVVIPGLNVLTFLQEAYTALTGHIVPIEKFREWVKTRMALIGMDEAFLYRNLNESFSGGEKKRLELLQCLVFQPKLAIFDEIDSGLDVDALHAVAQGVNYMRKKNANFTVLFITHYARILNLVEPDVVHIMREGTITQSGAYQLAQRVDNDGFNGFI